MTALFVVALLALGASPAAAGGAKIIIRGGTFHRGAPFDGGGPFHHHRFARPAPTIIYVVPSTPRWVPGYWNYQWIPQVYTSWVWIPGNYDPNGYWVEDHYAPQTVQTGYYQPIWISGYWDP